METAMGSVENGLSAEQLVDSLAAADRWGVNVTAWQLLELGPEHYERTARALGAAVDRGIPVRLLGSRLETCAPGFVPFAVELALGSLRHDPNECLAYRGENAADVPADVLGAGGDYRDELVAVLRQLVEDRALDPRLRWRAASRASLAGEEHRNDAERFLLAAGVADPQAGPVLKVRSAEEESELRAAVSAQWRRIEDYLAEHAPAALTGLAGPASPAELADVQRSLGRPLSVDFAASCMIHRAVAFRGSVWDHVEHLDLGDLAEELNKAQDGYGGWSGGGVDDEIRRDWGWRPGWVPLAFEPDGSAIALDLDPAAAGVVGQVIYLDQGMPDHVIESSWLDVLRKFAEELEAGTYRYQESTGELHHADSQD
ncbi:SMI1/KNR4 family protein [Streptomyces sp. BE230]|uniref:SMI1/KNR4 family protein n=1 Tax=Streptomyces sp. BE230 TaxID=3002526 RepID=UPI002ECFBDA4|nr:SMI1/KNR4 family protein [Streptomyces sp. BE230]